MESVKPISHFDHKRANDRTPLSLLIISDLEISYKNFCNRVTCNYLIEY